MNRELFGKIHNIISVEPEKLNMSGWEAVGECGTTRCIAGWAIALTTGKPLYGMTVHHHHQSVVNLADELGVDDVFEDIGAVLLDLDPDDAAALFYAQNDEATEFVRLAATEGEDAAFEYLEREII